MSLDNVPQSGGSPERNLGMRTGVEKAIQRSLDFTAEELASKNESGLTLRELRTLNQVIPELFGFPMPRSLKRNGTTPDAVVESLLLRLSPPQNTISPAEFSFPKVSHRIDVPLVFPQEESSRVTVGEQVGPYRIQRFLGRGAFAGVYKAFDEQSGRVVALKLGEVRGGNSEVSRSLEVTSERRPDSISPDEFPGEAYIISDSGAYSRTSIQAQEIDALIVAEFERLQSMNALVGPAFIGQEEHKGRPVLVTEFIPGLTLRDNLRNLRGIHLNWFHKLAGHLAEMEEEGLEGHGDLKPENVISPQGGGNGTFRAVDPSVIMPHPEGVLTTTTPFYNPMLAKSFRADIHAIGIMIYEVLTGTLPFDNAPWEFSGATEEMIKGDEEINLSRSLFLSFTPPSALNPKTPPVLEEIIRSALLNTDYTMKQLYLDLGRAIQEL